MKKKKKLGEMLLEAELLTEDQLRQALVDHKRQHLKLGNYLIRQGIVSETQIIELISRQLRIERYRPDKYPMDPGLSKLIPAEVARRCQAIPLMKKDYLCTIGMVDPMDIQALDNIEMIINCEVEPVICSQHELNQMMGTLYGQYTDLDDALESMERMEYDREAEAEEEAATEDVEVGSLHDLAEGAPVIRLVNSILSQAVREGASDVHISPEKDYVQVRFRLDGKLHEVPAPPKVMFLPLASRLKILANMDIAVSRVPQDGRFTLKIENNEINVRVSSLPTIYGENLVLRLLDTSAGVQSLERLGMSERDRGKVEDMIIKPHGMILSTGPTGSGKSTSLYSILKKINQPDINIITLEDPVEYRMGKIRQVQLNRQAGMTFASGLRSILRQDPDVIMVGEIRDAETAMVAVRAALTGHRVLSTVHTNDAAGAITRLTDMGIEPFLVSSVMVVSIAQRLVRTICPYCKDAYSPPREVLARWGLEKEGDVQFYRGKGCFQCMDSGYKGRTGIFEVLTVDEMIQDMILKGKSAQEITRTAKEAGRLRTLRDDAADKVLSGITTLEEAASVVVS